MNKFVTRFVAFAIAAVMVLGMLPAQAMAVEHSHDANALNSDVTPFTSTEDLIEQVKAQLIAAGAVYQPTVDQNVMEAVESESNYSYGEAATLLGMGFFTQREGTEGEIDTARLGLSKQTMKALVERVLENNSLSGMITVDYEIVDGIVASIDFSMRDSFAAGLEDIADRTSSDEAMELISGSVSGYSLTTNEGEDITPSEPVENEPVECAHTNTAVINAQASTCVAGGYTGDVVCIDCGTVVSAGQSTDPDPAAHVPADLDAITWNWTSSIVYGRDYDTLYYRNGQITVGQSETVVYDCATAEYDCAYCGVHQTVNTTVTEDLVDDAYIENAVMNAAMAGLQDPDRYAAFEAAYGEGLGMGLSDADAQGYAIQAACGDIINQTSAELAQDYNSTFYTASFNLNGNAVSNITNATKIALDKAWAEMCEFNAAYPQYFGYVTPYWTSKNTETKPMDAIIYVTNTQEEDLIPNSYLLMMVQMLPQAFMSYVMQYGGMLDAMLAEADAVINHSELDEVDKLLLMHEWLANNATFDMQDLIDQTTDPSQGSDPIAMTIFGALLNEQIPKDGSADWDGAVCLGYAAAYTVLAQRALGVKDADPKNARVDFVQIKYLANVAQSSIASGDSGFGDGEAMFNAPHYFNAVKLGNDWYHIDACYDDINVEVISQQRVETDGNLSHNYFLVAPTTMLEMYEGNYQYMDSLYDGVVFNRVFDQEAGEYLVSKDATMTGAIPKSQSDTNENGAMDDGYYYVYVSSTAAKETAYSNTQYENSWFVSAASEITYDPETQYFYYVSGQINSYSSLKDMFGDEEEDSSGDLGDLGEMDQDDMLEYKNDPAYKDKLVRRPVGATNVLEASSSGLGSILGDSYSQTFDDYAEALFHFGYGSIGRAAQADVDQDREDDEEASTDMEVGTTDGREGKYFDLIVAERDAYERYPDLVHSVVLMDGKLYFNMGSAIYGFDMSVAEMAEYAIDGLELELVQLKEYNDVGYSSNGKRFTGMSFVENASSGNVMRYHPIAALDVHNVVTWSDADGDGQADTRTSEPTLFVSIATNLTNSYKDSYNNAYAVEAVNYNPDYYRFMPEEEGAEEPNKNTEFMWCANIVDSYPVAGIVEELGEEAAYELVTVASYCDHAGFSEYRTVGFGLSDGSTKLVNVEDPAKSHEYAHNETENTLLCANCNQDHEHSYDYDEGKARIGIVWKMSDDKLTAEGIVYCVGDGCSSTKKVSATVSGPNNKGVYTASATYNETKYTSTMTVDQFNHKHTYAAPVAEWSENNTRCKVTFTCTESTSICNNLDGHRIVEMWAEVSQKTGSDRNEYNVGTITFQGETYTFNGCLHEHRSTKVETVDANCGQDGYIVYRCGTCGEDYNVENGHATGDHVWENDVCTVCGMVNPFTDVTDDCYYYEPVMWAVTRGITTGATATTFEPQSKCTRAHVVTFLYRLAGEPDVAGVENPFTDVTEDVYYYNAVLWAVENGITTGATATTFEPQSTCTRGQVVTFLYRMAGEPEISGVSNPFTDVTSDAYYYNPILWAVENGITTGATATTFEPIATCIRGQVVTFLYRYAHA